MKARPLIKTTVFFFLLTALPLSSQSKEIDDSMSSTTVATTSEKAKKSPIIGEWSAEGVAIRLDPDDPIALFGGAKVEKMIEQKMNEQLSKTKANPKKLKVIIRENGTFVLSHSSLKKAFKGTYTYHASLGMIEVEIIKGEFITFHVEKEGEQIKLMASVDKLFTLAKQLAKNAKSKEMIAFSELAQHYKGLKIGVKLKK